MTKIIPAALLLACWLPTRSSADSRPLIAAQHDCGHAASIACGETKSSTLDGSECALGGETYVEFWRFDAELAQTLAIYMTSSDFDTHLALIDPTLKTRAADNDGGVGSNARLEFTVPDQPGSWTIAAANIVGSDLGSYELSLECTAGDPNACIPEPDTLCLSDEPGDHRFRVEVSYFTAQGGGRSGNGQAISLADKGVARGGLFWFFAPDNPELLVKVLDGCALNGHFWVFYSAATNVGLNLTVTDTQTGATFYRSNPDLHPVATVQAVDAFDCP